MIAPRGVHHVALRVVDLPAVEPFYRDVLGLPLVKRWPNASGQGDRSIWLDTGDGAFLALETVPAGTTATAPDAARIDEATGPPVLALRITVAERAAWEQRLAAAGVAIYQRTSFTLFIRDPEGNRIGLSHYPQPAVD